MTVHNQISAHSAKQHERVKKFFELEERREAAIEEALHAYVKGENFEVAEINKHTNEINALAKQGIIPTRKLVTKEMVMTYGDKLKRK